MTTEQQVQLTSVAKALVLGGGIVLVVAGTIGVLGGSVSSFVNAPLGGLGRLGEGLLGVVIGLIALLAYRQLRNLGWTIVALILGVLAGGLGGALILIGALISLLATFVRT